MAEPVRHRQTKEAATDMFDLQPPRHIPTLPKPTFQKCLVPGRSGSQRSITTDVRAGRVWSSLIFLKIGKIVWTPRVEAVARSRLLHHQRIRPTEVGQGFAQMLMNRASERLIRGSWIYAKHRPGAKIERLLCFSDVASC
jgi:hypothetical protein